MTERRSWSQSRALLAALLVLLGRVAPQVAVAPASAAPSAVATATAVDETVLRTELTADLEAYLAARGGPEHVSAAGVSIDLVDRRSSIDVSAGTMTFGGSEPVRPDALWQVGSQAVPAGRGPARGHRDMAGRLPHAGARRPAHR